MRASALLMTVVQEKQGAKTFAMPKGLKSADIKLVTTVLAELDRVVISLEKQRTNVWDPLRPTLRSVNLGAYTTRGSGIT
eukprot:1130380-Amphidinium_carterae.1